MPRLQLPPTLRQLQPLLHDLAEVERFMPEMIDGTSENEGSRNGKRTLWNVKRAALIKAMEDASDFVFAMQLAKEGADAERIEAAFNAELSEIIAFAERPTN